MIKQEQCLFLPFSSTTLGREIHGGLWNQERGDTDPRPTCGLGQFYMCLIGPDRVRFLAPPNEDSPSTSHASPSQDQPVKTGSRRHTFASETLEVREPWLQTFSLLPGSVTLGKSLNFS